MSGPHHLIYSNIKATLFREFFVSLQILNQRQVNYFFHEHDILLNDTLQLFSGTKQGNPRIVKK